ncbi:hypothetical protein HPB48_015992 [Haemaphysalis longicornis]|uniref:Uncharacterized protein n=1 Tax=Haemaphysalis longicornis TaxID=44386 RepID=A0A9J6G3J6_HAELO|nr:hypothetical protein HPB48_015992 [Haemaphysalis longicornis]
MALHKRYHSNLGVCYADTARYPGRSAVTAVVVDQKGNAISSCSVTPPRPDTGEEVAIALAITGTRASSNHIGFQDRPAQLRKRESFYGSGAYTTDSLSDSSIASPSDLDTSALVAPRERDGP